MTSSKRKEAEHQGEARGGGHEAPTREVEVLSADFAASLLQTAEYEYADDDRTTTRALPEDFDDPDDTGEHADRAALEAARLIVVEEAPRTFQSSPPPPATEPATTSATPMPAEAIAAEPVPSSRRRGFALVLVLVLVLLAGLAAIVTQASVR